jgi:predicted aspartyl protease
MTTTDTLSPRLARLKFRLAGGAQPLILLPVRVNDQGPFDFILDTGAGTSLLSSELAQRLGVEIVASKEGQTAGGKVAIKLGRVASLAAGRAELKNVDVGIVDLTPIGRAVGAKVDGDLGYNFLKHHRITIDYHSGEITFEDPKRIERLQNAAQTEVPIRLASAAKPLILVDVYANGRGPFQFAIDTGTSTSAITPELAVKLGIETSPLAPVTTSGTNIDVTTGTLRSFQVGGAAIDNMAAIVGNFLQMLSEAIGTKLDGIVGYNFLRNYKVVLDYPNQTLSLI